MSTERCSVPQVIKASETFTVNTGQSDMVETRTISYFKETLDIIGYNEEATGAFCERVSSVFTRGGRPTDNRVELLIARDQIVASVIQRRDRFNFIQVAAACYLTPDMLDALRSDPELLRQQKPSAL